VYPPFSYPKDAFLDRHRALFQTPNTDAVVFLAIFYSSKLAPLVGYNNWFLIITPKQNNESRHRLSSLRLLRGLLSDLVVWESMRIIHSIMRP
jgi:hypothetical protein